MKITDKITRKDTFFCRLAEGAVFKSEDSNNVFLKLCNYSIFERNDDELCEEYNAYDLTESVLTFFEETERVEEISAELILT